MAHTVRWWLDRLDNVHPVSDGFMARCPAHDDQDGHSFHVSPKDLDAEAVTKCFAGCSYRATVEAVESSTQVTVKTSKPVVSVRTKSSKEPSVWWAEYTGVPWEEWEKWGCRALPDRIQFSWSGASVTKNRFVDSKEFKWEPTGASAPPFWPMISDTLPEQIWITEGESDCGVLRHLGFEAFTITRGAGASRRLTTSLWMSLHDRGARRVAFCFDLDPEGRAGALEHVQTCRQSLLVPQIVDISSLAQSLLGEKDVRDLWRRLQDAELLHRELSQLAEKGDLGRSETRLQLSEFLATPLERRPWLVDKIWLAEAVGLIVGAPKMGKSWLALDLGLSVATGTPFLGRLPVPVAGPVVYVSKEDPDYLLYDRLAKILIAKGLGGGVSPRTGVYLPPKLGSPFFLDLGRSFLFEDNETDALLFWLDQIRRDHGDIALVVFDPILRMMSGIDEFKAGEVGGTVFHTAERLQRETGAAVAMVHHRPKAKAVGKGAYGSIAFHAFSENTLYIQGDDMPQDGWIEVRNEFKSEASSKWAYHLELGEYYLAESVIPRREDI